MFKYKAFNVSDAWTLIYVDLVHPNHNPNHMTYLVAESKPYKDIVQMKAV